MLKSKSMPLKVYESLLSLVLILGFGACSGSTSSTTPASKSFGQLALNEQINSIEDQLASFRPIQTDPNLTASYSLLKNSRLASFGKKMNSFLFPSLMAGQTTFTDIWQTDQMIVSNYCDNLDGCQPIYQSIKDRLSQELDVNFVPKDKAPLGVLSQIFQINFIICALANVAKDQIKDRNVIDENGLLVTGNYSLTLYFSQAPDKGSFLGCNLPAGGIQTKSDMLISMVVKPTTDQTIYNKSYMVTFPDSSTMSMYLKKDTSTNPLNVSILQVSANQKNVERAIYSVVDSTMLLDYVSQDYGAAAGSANAFRFHRVFISLFGENKYGKDKGYLVSGRDSFNAAGSPTSPNPHGSQFLHVSVAAKPLGLITYSTTSSTAISIEMQDQLCTNTVSPLCKNGLTDPVLTAGSFNGCINTKTGIVTDNKDGSLICDLTGSDVKTAGSMMRATYAAHATGPQTYTLSETVGLNWTDPTGDMLTAVQAN